MASALAEAHIEAQRRLRVLTGRGVTQIWNALPGYDRADVPTWLSAVVPLVNAAQRQSVALTDGYLAQAMNRAPLGINPDALIGAAVRNGTSPNEVYTRPMIALWSGLAEGKLWADASSAALARAVSSSAMDVQLSMARTAQEIGRVDPQLQKFQRVADGSACAFCQEVDGAILNSDDAMPLHNNCGCSVEPADDSASITPLPDSVAVNDHGELGPLLGDPSQSFMTEAEAYARH